MGHWHQYVSYGSLFWACSLGDRRAYATRVHWDPARPPPSPSSRPQTRYPPIDSRNNQVVADYACMSADNSTYTNPKYPTLIVTGAPGDIEVNPDHCE